MSGRYGPWPCDRPTALQLGTRHFFTGRACARGHVGLRITANGNCLACKREAERESGLERLRILAATETLEQRRAKLARYQNANRTKRNAKKRETREFERFMRNMEAGQ